jgi:transcriptional regulator with XRE-family HTH domain
MTIGERIAHALEMRRMTQKELANKTRLTEVTISRYINNQRVPKATHIITLCKVLCVSADWLLGVKENGNVD